MIEIIKENLLRHGEKIHDYNLNRDVIELICQDHSLSPTQMDQLEKNIPLNPKYEPELKNISTWYDEHFPKYHSSLHRRHIVYFNNQDYDNVHQCISLFQV